MMFRYRMRVIDTEKKLLERRKHSELIIPVTVNSWGRNRGSVILSTHLEKEERCN